MADNLEHTESGLNALKFLLTTAVDATANFIDNT